jgi:hypothetical protein
MLRAASLLGGDFTSRPGVHCRAHGRQALAQWRYLTLAEASAMLRITEVSAEPVEAAAGDP